MKKETCNSKGEGSQSFYQRVPWEWHTQSSCLKFNIYPVPTTSPYLAITSLYIPHYYSCSHAQELSYVHPDCSVVFCEVFIFIMVRLEIFCNLNVFTVIWHAAAFYIAILQISVVSNGFQKFELPLYYMNYASMCT